MESEWFYGFKRTLDRQSKKTEEMAIIHISIVVVGTVFVVVVVVVIKADLQANMHALGEHLNLQ
jgi:hypothetical protein